jgi:small subunit ribosomal protein S21
MYTNHIGRPRKNEDPNRFVKRFIKKCKKLGIIDEVKDRRYYKKPSVAKKEKQIRAQRERARAEMKKRRAKERRNRRNK